MNHRQVQRTLFRMQLDPAFATQLRAGAQEATSDLGAEELCLLQGADPRAIAVDRDGKRRGQFLANVTSEFALSVAGGLDVDGFTASAEFHDAVRTDASLPLAFARYADRCCRDQITPLRALVALETALAHARRERRNEPESSPGQIALAASATLVGVPGGTLALAADQRAALDAGTALPSLFLAPAPDETLLLRSSPAASEFRLRDVSAELVSPALAALLRETRVPCSRLKLSKSLVMASADLTSVIDELVADGVLVEGS